MTSSAVGRVPCRQTWIRSPGQTRGSRILTLLLVSHGSGRAAPPHSAAAATSSHHTCTSRRGCTRRHCSRHHSAPPTLAAHGVLATTSTPAFISSQAVHGVLATTGTSSCRSSLAVHGVLATAGTPACSSVISGRPRCPCHRWYTSLSSLFCSVLFLVTPPTLHTIRSGRAVEPLSRRTPW